jgi:hypothetical protein
VIGVGGGALLDSAKVLARRLGVPLVAIPTIAATCAAWTPLSVWYSDAGQALNPASLYHTDSGVHAAQVAAMVGMATSGTPRRRARRSALPATAANATWRVWCRPQVTIGR